MIGPDVSASHKDLLEHQVVEFHETSSFPLIHLPVQIERLTVTARVHNRQVYASFEPPLGNKGYTFVELTTSNLSKYHRTLPFISRVFLLNQPILEDLAM